MRFLFYQNRDFLKNGTLISIRRTGDGFHPGLFNFIEILDLYNTCMKKKYYEYTLDKLARAIWENTFSTPLLSFDAVWEYHSEGYLKIKDIDDLKSRAASLSKSEHLFLAIFLQQYNNALNNYIHDFNQIPSLVNIDTHNKAKLVELIDFFDSFPLLFNGERIKLQIPAHLTMHSAMN
ncbi:MAG: hypothetical protein MR998_07120 [Lachnospiraceae bacterium]|nr:hypothetical protein [Lachnospiraceae bacterium]